MARMVRKQFFITKEQNRKLKEHAAATGVSEAEVVRAGIDMRLAGKVEKADWRSLAESLSGSWAEREDLEDGILRKNRQGRKRRHKRLDLP